MRGLSERTVRRQWDKARICLHGKVQAGRQAGFHRSCPVPFAPFDLRGEPFPLPGRRMTAEINELFEEGALA